MKLTVQVLEARNLPSMDLNGFSDPYVRMQIRRHDCKTKVVYKNLNPTWDEKFTFQVEDLNDELSMTVMDEDKYSTDDFIGRFVISVATIYDAPHGSIESEWYPLQPLKKRTKQKDFGEIRLAFSLDSNSSIPQTPSLASESSSPFHFEAKSEQESLTNRSDSKTSFEELLRLIESNNEGEDIPQSLPGGILVDQAFITSTAALNSYLFSPDSDFLQSLAEIQGTTALEQEPWVVGTDGRMTREVTYTKAASKLIKAVKATEEQTYLKVVPGGGQSSYAILSSVSTPDVPYGTYFKTEILFTITPGPELPSDEDKEEEEEIETSLLIISWRTNFISNTMMKGMIENGTRQGLKETYTQYVDFLSQKFKPVDLKDLGATSKDQILASLTVQKESDLKLASRILGNFTVFSSVIITLYVFLHIMLRNQAIFPNGLEFSGLDLPDSVGAVVVCIILTLQGERSLKLLGQFLQARKQKGGDHGIKAQGDGWLLTVALISGDSLGAVNTNTSPDPYIVFTCNGKTKTSSIKFQTSDPQWNEIFEFDAMDNPPSVMRMNVYDFDGPFCEANLLGYAEINFVKSNLSELADVWIPLKGNLAQACQSKVHLRVFLNNTRGTEVGKDYLDKMEKEFGKKIILRSPHTNSTFQKLFSLPVEEFIINDFSCYLKRKMPLQGRLFLSPRIIGFSANLFGRKTKFYFLWEDIEEIKTIPPTLASVGSPSLKVFLLPGKGMDARHGAKTRDSKGRLIFQFQSFVSFQNANRTIMVLWKAKSRSPEQIVKLVEEESESKNLLSQQEESGQFINMEDANTIASEVFSSVVDVSVNLLMELFSGGLLDRKVMEALGCSEYHFTHWETIKPDVQQRQIDYQFSSTSGNAHYQGKVISSQQKTKLSEKNGWFIEEVITPQGGVPYGEYFNVHIKYQIEDIAIRTNACNVQVSMGIQWLKYTKQQKRMTKSIVTDWVNRIQDMLRIAEQFITAK